MYNVLLFLNKLKYVLKYYVFDLKKNTLLLLASAVLLWYHKFQDFSFHCKCYLVHPKLGQICNSALYMLSDVTATWLLLPLSSQRFQFICLLNILKHCKLWGEFSKNFHRPKEYCQLPPTMDNLSSNVSNIGQVYGFDNRCIGSGVTRLILLCKPKEI